MLMCLVLNTVLCSSALYLVLMLVVHLFDEIIGRFLCQLYATAVHYVVLFILSLS